MEAGRPPTTLNYQDKVPMDYKPKKKKLKSNNTIGYRGVTKNGKNRFAAKINIDGNVQYLGNFGTAKEAAIAFDLAAIQAKRPKSDLNFNENIEKVNTNLGWDGVFAYKHPLRNYFFTTIMIDGKEIRSGSFYNTAIDAAKVRDSTILQNTCGNFKDSRLNFTEEEIMKYCSSSSSSSSSSPSGKKRGRGKKF
jgi:hypothetical protein